MPPIDISIVTGTYNRRAALEHMIDSVRNTVPHSLRTEIIVVDNASTDATWKYLEDNAQAIESLQMGSQVGAVEAFTEGAKAAHGKYVLLATDDIEFPPFAIVAAWSHLEASPTCGAVAFAHDKITQGHFQTDMHKARREDGTQTATVYPQIALVRRWLGDHVGWWGGDHPKMSQAFTYGGDNFLGAGIVEAGYTVDTVRMAQNIEHRFDDESRELSVEQHKASAQVYRSIYPHGPTIASAPQVFPPEPERERLRVLLINDYDPTPGMEHHKRHKRGLREALGRVAAVIDYDYRRAGEASQRQLPLIAEALQPHIILGQVHKTNIVTANTWRDMKRAAPRAVIMNRIGDVWEENHIKPGQLAAWKYLNCLLTVNGTMIPRLEREGVAARLWLHSFEPADEPVQREVPEHRVVFMGNGYQKQRRELMQLVDSIEGGAIYARSGIEEAGVTSMGHTHYLYHIGRAIYANALIAVGDQQFPEAREYVSNRMMEIMAAGGALCLQQVSEGLDEVSGLKDGTHYIAWTDFDDLREKIAYWLADENQKRRKQIVRNAKNQARKNHTFDVRVKELLTEIVPGLADESQS